MSKLALFALRVFIPASYLFAAIFVLSSIGAAMDERYLMVLIYWTNILWVLPMWRKDARKAIDRRLNETSDRRAA